MISLLILAAVQFAPESYGHERYRACVVRHFRTSLPTYSVELRLDRAISACSGQRAVAENEIWQSIASNRKSSEEQHLESAKSALDQQLKQLDESLKSEVLAGKFEGSE